MSEFKETITTSQDEGIDQTGSRVQQKTRRIDTQASADGTLTAANVVWFILGFIEVLLGLRFILKLFGANPGSGFVNFIYSFTGIMTAPFDNIFGVATTQAGEVRSVFEPSILVAAAIYALIGWGIVKLLTINRPE